MSLSVVALKAAWYESVPWFLLFSTHSRSVLGGLGAPEFAFPSYTWVSPSRVPVNLVNSILTFWG